MKNTSKTCKLMSIFCLVITSWLSGAYAGNRLFNDSIIKKASKKGVAPLIGQTLDYTENPIDVPNPDRGFYIPSRYIVPVEEIEEEPSIPSLGATIAGTKVFTNTRIVYMKFDLRNFSSNAPLNGIPKGPWSAHDDIGPNYGTTQPLTTAAIDYIRAALQKIRESEAVAMVVFSYDSQGYTYNNRGGYNQFIHDCEPGAPKGRLWYETGAQEASDLCGIPGHEDKNWVEYHLWQLGNIYSEFEDCIMVVKGGIFGPWGEMHSTTYSSSKEGYHWLLEALLEYVPTSRSILAHAGAVMAWHNVEYGTKYNFSNILPVPERGTRAQRFGMFNDSYSRGGNQYTDGGSLSEGLPLVGGNYERNAVLTWIRNQNNFYGGETVRSGNEPDNFYRLYPRFPNVPYEAAYAQTTHLNTSYSSAAYSLWNDFVYTEENITKPFTPPHDGVTRTAIFDPVYQGRSGMEYIRDRLGYRLVLREANASEWVDQNGTLIYQGKIQNVGFGNIINKKNVSVILQSKDGHNIYSALTDIDARDWYSHLDSRATNKEAWRALNFTINLAEFGQVKPGEYNIYLKINDPKETSKNKRAIQFANYNIWNASLSANLIGSTTIIP